MASRAIPVSHLMTRIARATASLSLLALILTLLPCFAQAAAAQAATAQTSHPQLHRAAGHCASCCTPSSTPSTQALCCEAHTQPAHPCAIAGAPQASQQLTYLAFPQSLSRLPVTPSQAHLHQHRPPLLTVLRI